MDKIASTKAARLAQECARRFPLSKEVQNALASTNREVFVHSGLAHNAYTIDALPIGSSQFISSPLTVAKMTEYLECVGVDRVLEVGCGSGYQAAVLSHLVRGVFTIERIESLVLQAKQRFRSLGISNVHVRLDDGQNGWIQYAPYDRIIFSATAKEIPLKLFNQLKDGGILVAPMQKKDTQVITRFRKNGSKISVEELEKCDFVPVLNGVEK